MEISTQEIIRALRCSANPTAVPDEVCAACPYCISEEWEGIHIAACDCDRIAMDAAERLEKIESKASAQWIRCSDRLPEKDGHYLVATCKVFEAMTVRYVTDITFCASLKLWNASEGCTKYAFQPGYVTHWMELPGLPVE